MCNIPELYYHRTEKRIDFDGYFNLFYIEKRKIYTELEGVSLELSLKGYDELLIVTNQKELKKFDLAADKETQYTIELPYLDCDKGTLWFALAENPDITERKVSGFYYGEVSENKFRSVNIGIDICTFKREAYIVRNLGKLSRKLINNKELEVSDHMQVFIIDNGRTLQDCQEVQHLKASTVGVHIIPNMNAGGSGGFTRGMIEILNRKEQEGFTHILIMDDDAIVEPDTLVRLYGFLATVKDEWKDITVGGALLREEHPYILFCAGEWWEDGYTVPNPYTNLDLRERDKAACSYLTETGHEHSQYSGWWCCCYSLNTVRHDNLPIPFFLHHDDIEYGIRNRAAGIVFLNGINIWHRDVELGLPGTNMYYDVRNTLIEMALQRVEKSAAVKRVCRYFVGSILRFRYKDVTLICRGVKDFLKGPGWLYKQKPEKLHKDISSMASQALTLEELETLLPKHEYSFVIKQIEVIRKEMQKKEGFEAGMRPFKVKLLHLITLNGWVLPAVKGVKVVQIKDSAFEGFRRKKVVLYDVVGEKVVVFEKRYGELVRVSGMFLKVILGLMRKFNYVSEEYRNNIGKIANKAAWERYLELK